MRHAITSYRLKKRTVCLKRTALYALQAHQRAQGQTLVASGVGTSIVDAVAVVGDSRNTTPSSGPSQFVGMVGLRHAF